MNTAVRTLPPQQFATRQHEQKLKWKQTLQKIALIILVLVSAFSVVYIKDLHRRMFMVYQSLQDEQTQIHVEWGKLLLDQTSWSTQARIQKIATERLGMQAPMQDQVTIVK